MSLMKWFRKNNRKILAVAVAGLLIVWLGGSALRMTCGYVGPGPGEAVAFFGRNQKITRSDLNQANAELSTLLMIKADALLRGGDIHRFFLGELLFSEGRGRGQIVAALQQFIRRGQLRISDEQILSLYNKTQTNEVYWYLLKREAAAAGVAVSNDAAKNILQQIIPKLFQDATYAQVMNGLVARGISEDDVFSAFGSLLAVLECATSVCSTEDLTTIQISQLISDQLQSLNADVVRFRAEVFADEQAQPTAEQVEQQFEKYKGYYPGQVTEDNPFGFGYKLDERAKLDYIIVKLDDVRKIIAEPTAEEEEKYYLAHTSQFTEKVPSDPNDPNSALVEHTKRFGEVAGIVRSLMIDESVTNKAEAILAKAKQSAQAKYGDSDPAEMTVAQLKDKSVDFGPIAGALSEENGITVYSGRTGLLTPLDMLTDQTLAGLYFGRADAHRTSPQHLSELAFSVGKKESAALALTGEIKPKLYQVIGPLNDLQRKFAALVRVVELEPAAEPQNPDVTFKAAPVSLGGSEKPASGARSVGQQAAEDLKKLAAMETAKQRCTEFQAIAQKDGWQQALDRFNKRYPRADANEPNNFELTKWTGLRRPSAEEGEALAAQTKGMPGGRFTLFSYNQNEAVLDVLFSLVPADSNAPKELPTIVEVKGDLSYYCIKSLSVKRIDRNQYEQTKGLVALKEDDREVQNLAAIFFKPENILKRMNFKPVRKTQQPAEPNEQAPAGETVPQEPK
jgi:hypothetical protein